MVSGDRIRWISGVGRFTGWMSCDKTRIPGSWRDPWVQWVNHGPMGQPWSNGSTWNGNMGTKNHQNDSQAESIISVEKKLNVCHSLDIEDPFGKFGKLQRVQWIPSLIFKKPGPWQVGVLPYQMALGAELLSLSQVEMPGVRWEQIDLLKRRQLIHDVFFRVSEVVQFLKDRLKHD